MDRRGGGSLGVCHADHASHFHIGVFRVGCKYPDQLHHCASGRGRGACHMSFARGRYPALNASCGHLWIRSRDSLADCTGHRARRGGCASREPLALSGATIRRGRPCNNLDYKYAG